LHQGRGYLRARPFFLGIYVLRCRGWRSMLLFVPIAMRPKKESVLNKLARVGLLGVGLFVASGCAGSQPRNSSSQAPGGPRVLVAQPGTVETVQVVSRDQHVAAGGVVGSHHLSTGDEIQVATYVHTYPDPIESFPRVYWADSWYYNVHGDFVFYDPYYDSWVYYYGAPSPLVTCWNGYYPYSPYYWGQGYYGSGWYWGGVGVYGYHAYGIPVTNPHHHHHGSHGHNSNGVPAPASGRPANKPSAGGPGSPMAEAPRRTKPNVDGPVREPGSQTPPTRSVPKGSDGGPVRAAAPSRADDRPGLTRATVPAGAAAPSRAASPSRATPPRGIRPSTTVPSRAARGSGNSMTTASGQQITTIGGPSRSAGPRKARTIGMTDPFNAPAANRGRSNRASWSPSVRRPAPAGASSRSAGRAASPSRAGSASASGSGWAQPTRSAPSRAGSSRAQPSRTTPSRGGSSPSRSTYSSSPSRSSSGRSSGRSSSPSRSPSRSSSGRSSSPSRSPSRSSSSRSSGRSSSPSRSPSRSSSSRSSSSRSSSSRSSSRSSSSRSSGRSRR